MTYNKKFLYVHYSLLSQEQIDEISREKEYKLISFFEKLNNLNQQLQKHKLEIYVLKIIEQFPNKIKNILNEIQTNFINLITLLNNEIKEAKIPLKILLIDLEISRSFQFLKNVDKN